jgi:cation-transporting P-type ATPase E
MSDLQGLSQSEVLARRSSGLGNDVRLKTSRSYSQILRENVFTFVNDVLFGLGIALIALGRISDALVSVGVVLLNTVVSVVQEVRAKRTLDHIALLSRPKATVIRDGQEQPVDLSEIVQGDILLVRPGDQIVVDGAIVGPERGRIDVDESLLTGESDLIAKGLGDPVFSGSFCVTGSALYEAQKVGAASLAHQITAGAQAFRRVYTPLQRQIDLIVRVILLVAVYFEIMLVVESLLNRSPLVESVKTSTVVAGLIPNGLFVAIAVAYALGAVRIVGKGALVQQANAVESLSNVDVLCLDKTGTLTANRIKLDQVRPLAMAEEELRHLLGDYAVSTAAGNRTNAAICETCGGEPRRVLEEVPFSSERKWSAIAFDDPARSGLYVLGAPEMLRPYLSAEVEQWEGTVQDWTSRGLRVLLFANAPINDGLSLRDPGGKPQLPADLAPLGWLTFSDELRPEAQETLRRFAEAGIRLKIISGDNPETVAALAKQAGLGADIRVVSGLDLVDLDDGQMAQLAESGTIFGRITPQQKEALVQALHRRGHYVAMMGDGVNDVLSLKQANLGIAMESGSQATRSVADIILLKDSFGALPHAFREGQRILNGMHDILKLFLTRVLYTALLIAALGLFEGFPFTPKYNSLLALFAVGIPSIALAAWARPGLVPRTGLIRELLHFVLPAVLTMSLFGVGVYVSTLVLNSGGLVASVGGDSADALVRATPVAQSALTTFSVLCALLLIVFVEPPTPAWTGGDVFSGDWKPSIMAAGLFFAYVLIIAYDPLRQFFELAPLAIVDYLLISLAVAAWAFTARLVWRARLLDRFLGVDLRTAVGK